VATYFIKKHNISIIFNLLYDFGSGTSDETRNTVHEEPDASGLDDTADGLDDIAGNAVHGKAAPNAGLDDMDGMDDISAIFSGEEVSL